MEGRGAQRLAAPSCRSEAAVEVAAPSTVESQGSLPHPRASPPSLGIRLCPIKESGCATRSPRARPARSLACACRARAQDRDSGAGVLGGMARGSLANRRALLRPPDVARRKMLQPWTAPRSVSQVQGAAAEGGSAAGTTAVGQGGGKRERGERRPLESAPPPRAAPPWLAGTFQ